MNKNICIYLKCDGYNSVCIREIPPKILGDCMGYSGKTCIQCRFKMTLKRRDKNELRK